ncbi:hypothetical protein G7046_g9925 [Stylonectria norvegica]|nr:hypothetical protein G7046_g9925 [Stylonectria norvegica]
MAENLDPATASSPDRPGLERRRSRNPLKNMFQHLSVEPPEDDDDREGRKSSLIRRLSWRKSRSPSANSERSASTPAQDPNLCQACASWASDVDSTFAEMDAEFIKAVNPGSQDAFENKEHSLTRLKDLEDNRWSAKCPLCKLFWAVHVPSEGDGDLFLSGFSSRDTNYLIDTNKLYELGHPARGKGKGFSPAFLAVVPKKSGDGALSWDVSADWFRSAGMLYRTLPSVETGHLSPRPEGKHSRGGSMAESNGWVKRGIWGREMEQTIDLSIGVDWLRFCEFYHQGRCGRRPVTREMKGFRLVDCAQSPPRVVDASIMEHYVALSYVWGKNTTETLPKVIQDAVTVTKGLGVRYLWVDRLCVDDSRPQEKMHQIGRMDEIFEGAILTIVAACGEDATHGLPGVGSTTRAAQPKYEFVNSDTTLVSSLQDPRLAVKNSTWYTRGWTYQEGLLARRRLIFTDQQMYWECEGMCCPESLVIPLEFYHDMEEQRMCDFMRPGLFNGVSFVDGSWERWKRLPSKVEEPSTLSIFREADQHIVNYTKRDLTYDEDSLNAFLGISKRLENSLGRGKVVNLLGIPIWAPVDERSMTSPPRTRDIFALSTCFWHHKDGIVASRRSHLPSWTWAGWKGPVELYSNIVVADPEGKIKDRKYNNHHYVSATHVTRNDASSLRWTYSPDIVLVNPDGSVAYDFSASDASRTGPPALPIRSYGIHVPNPLVLDRVKARTHAGGWIFNNVSVDVRLSRGPASIRDYIGRHAKGEQMTVLWFVEEALVMLLVVERAVKDGRVVWERVGRMRMGFAEEAKDVMKRYGRLEKMVEDLPLRRLGQDIVIEPTPCVNWSHSLSHPGASVSPNVHLRRNDRDTPIPPAARHLTRCDYPHSHSADPFFSRIPLPRLVVELSASMPTDHLAPTPTNTSVSRVKSTASTLSDYGYPNGHLGHLNPHEEDAFRRFKDLLEERGVWKRGPPASHDDPVLLRYLRARRWIVEDAFQQFKDTEDWRAANDIEVLYNTIDLEAYEQSRRLYPMWTGRRDRRGIPLYVFEIKTLDSKTVHAYEKVGSSKTFSQAKSDGKTPSGLLRLFALYENLTRFNMPFCTQLPDREFPEVPITMSTNIVDISGVGLKQFWNLKSHMQAASQLATAHYPETLDRIFIIGAPMFFNTVWSWIKRWFDPITVSKIFVLGTHEAKAVLESYIDPANIPKKYGGQLDYKSGDLGVTDPAWEGIRPAAMGGH